MTIFFCALYSVHCIAFIKSWFESEFVQYMHLYTSYWWTSSISCSSFTLYGSSQHWLTRQFNRVSKYNGVTSQVHNLIFKCQQTSRSSLSLEARNESVSDGLRLGEPASRGDRRRLTPKYSSSEWGSEDQVISTLVRLNYDYGYTGGSEWKEVTATAHRSSSSSEYSSRRARSNIIRKMQLLLCTNTVILEEKLREFEFKFEFECDAEADAPTRCWCVTS